MPRILIGDGFDFTFTSEPTLRTPEPVTIEYRPPTLLSLRKYDATAIATSPETQAQGQADFLAENIGRWNAVGADDKPLPIEPGTFLKVRDWWLLRQFADAIASSKIETANQQKK